MKKKNLIYYFKPILNWILEHIYVLVLCVVLVVILIEIKNEYIQEMLQMLIEKLSPLDENSIISGLVVAAIIAIINAIFRRLKPSLSIKSLLKRDLYQKSRQLYESKQTPRRLKKIIPYLVNFFYYNKKVAIKQQQEAVDSILSSMNDITSNKEQIYWIVGSSYSGKTMTVLNLLKDLILKKKHDILFQKLDGKIVYFDLGKPDGYLESFLEDYRQGEFSDCLIILDNLHKLSEKNCFTIIDNLVIEKCFFALIVLMRSPNEFIGENSSLLDNITKTTGCCYELCPLSITNFEIKDHCDFDKFCSDFFPMEMVISNGHLRIHLYTLYIKQQLDTSKIIPEIQAFLGFKNFNACAYAAELSAIIVCSLFSGSFNLKFVLDCNSSLTEDQMKQMLLALSKIGFLTPYPNSHEDYFFHEELAKSYFKYTYTQRNEAYRRIFQNIESSKHFFEKATFKFLYRMPIAEYSYQQKLFEQIANNTNFLNLYENISFLLGVNVCKEKYYKEQGILCDRCGKLQEAKKLYINYFDETHSADAFYKLVQVDHLMINDSLKKFMLPIDKNDYYSCSLQNYWNIHIAMHLGRFEFQKIYNLAKTVQAHVDTIIEEHPYDGLHFIRRLYFDIFRLYYLEGILAPEKLQEFGPTSGMYCMLNAKLDEFKAYYYKFAIGMMLGQDILFALIFSPTPLEYSNYKFLFMEYPEIDHMDTRNGEAIAKQAIEAYHKAINYMHSIGDKTEIFVKYHMYNVKMYLINDGNYTECEKFYETYNLFANEERIPEYQAYARLYRIKLNFVKLCAPANISPDSVTDEKRKKWKYQLSSDLDQAQKKDILLNNQYADLRLMLYKTLYEKTFNQLSNHKFLANLNQMIKIAEKNNYKREQKIFSYIKNQLKDDQLSFQSIREIVTGYPIVPQ